LTLTGFFDLRRIEIEIERVMVMYADLKGKTGLVTGSGKENGIGYAICRKLAGSGMNLVLADLGGAGGDGGPIPTGTMAEMERLARQLTQEYKVAAIPAAVDVTDSASISRMIETVRERFGRIDVLCNNAGASFGVPNLFHTYAEADWLKTIDVNLHSVFRVSRAALPLMTGAGGTIINTASRAGKVPPLFNGAYAVAKAGLIMLTKVMALELAGLNIRVNAVCPGQIMTDLEKWRFGLEAQFYSCTVDEREQAMCQTIPLRRIGSPDEVAGLVAFLSSRESSYMTGQAVNVTGGQLMEL
jgi:NAD(P)-dependent dehydrogenase (short-subunit alcohol dehydrogenase family)